MYRKPSVDERDGKVELSVTEDQSEFFRNIVCATARMESGVARSVGLELLAAADAAETKKPATADRAG